MAKIDVTMSGSSTETDALNVQQQAGSGAIVQVVRDSNGKVVKIVLGLPDSASQQAHNAIAANKGVATTDLFPVVQFNNNLDTVSTMADIQALNPAAIDQANGEMLPGSLIFSSTSGAGCEVSASGKSWNLSNILCAFVDSQATLRDALNFEWQSKILLSASQQLKVQAPCATFQVAVDPNNPMNCLLQVSNPVYGSNSVSVPLLGGQLSFGQDDSGYVFVTLSNQDSSVSGTASVQLPVAVGNGTIYLSAGGGSTRCRVDDISLVMNSAL